MRNVICIPRYVRGTAPLYPTFPSILPKIVLNTSSLQYPFEACQAEKEWLVQGCLVSLMAQWEVESVPCKSLSSILTPYTMLVSEYSILQNIPLKHKKIQPTARGSQSIRSAYADSASLCCPVSERSTHRKFYYSLKISKCVRCISCISKVLGNVYHHTRLES